MVNYINLSFDYDTVYEKDGKPYISNDVVSSWWTGRIEFLDDAFFYSHWACVCVVAWSLQTNTSIVLWDGKFSVQRTKNNLEKKFYKDFWTATTTQECEMIRQAYNDALFEFALEAIENIRAHRKEKWLAPIVYDFIHTPTSWLTIGAAKKLSQYFQIPLISSIHVDEKEIQSLKWNQYPWADFILKKDNETKTDSDWIIAKNTLLYDQILPIQKNCINIGNDLNFPVYNEKILQKKNPNSILYVWRISYAKWFDRLTKMIEKINMTPNEYTFVICGKIRDNGEISKDINRLKQYDNVIFEWQVGRTAIQDVFLEAGTFILPSRTEIYNQTIMEALFYWCNIICTDVWAAREQIWGCKSAYIFPNDDGFMSKWLDTLSCIKYNYENSVSAYKYANKKFNSNVWRKYKMDFLNEIFSKKT